ncbi:MAG TPA: endonuclease/exonuclease/phosphatase family protein [Vicinamibacterales bacterium]
MTLTVLTYNLRYGGLGREDPIAAVIRARDPDLVVLQEATRPEVVRDLAERLDMPAWGAHRGRSLGYLSRVALATANWHKPRWSRHAFLELVPEGADAAIFGVHLSAVHSNWTERRRVLEVRSLLTAIRPDSRGPHAVLGDFNTLAPGEQLDLGRLPPRLRAVVYLTGRRLRWQTIELMLQKGYVDGYRTHRPDHPGYTFPSWDPHVRLDYVFLPRAHVHRLIACEIAEHDRAPLASDHVPLLARLEI